MAAQPLAPMPIGWPLLPVPDERGELGYPSLEQSVRESIEVLLRTRPGEQLMRRDFGAGLERLLHLPNTLATRRQLRDLVAESLARWEPRVVVDLIEVGEIDGSPTEVRIEIAYRLKRTGAPQRVGLTADLEGS